MKGEEKYNLLIKDEQTLERIETGDNREAHRQDIQDTVDIKTRAEVIDFENSPTNPLRQWGAAMTTADFEEKLTRILPHFCKIMQHPTDVTKRCLWLVMPDGEREHLTAWE
jgi:hypothetical protein